MSLTEIPDALLHGDGVTFRYLIFQLHRGEERKTVLRAVNYLPYHSHFDETIIRLTKEELEGQGFFDRNGDFSVEGGGTLSLNRYYDTITLYGADPAYGAEQDRSGAAEMLRQVFPDYEISLHEPSAA